ncbi:MAG: hypothetical protein BAA00_15110 [Parageobacillus thermoglucosidasius]|uniref:Uncharacterized protein n=2 Tax=Anoxybacillaceae TaxID=3120669 RepID=A0A7U3YCT3_GEOS0|nr:hypothetical protein [Parageobacillus thermoglucosidasius]OUM92427.1 MAG: hypothetical protein BAA00_15110 [Parageobacillus thermoglucosidasius]RDE29466.1 hypothetical protein DV714_00225 [Parageobacillus thermoglucosidasius]
MMLDKWHPPLVVKFLKFLKKKIPRTGHTVIHKHDRTEQEMPAITLLHVPRPSLREARLNENKTMQPTQGVGFLFIKKKGRI